jgi:hypothetical protein
MKSVRFHCLSALVAAFVLVVAAPAFAQDKVGDESPAPDAGPNCDITGYKTERQTLTPPFAFSDNTATDVLVGGPLLMPADGDIINDVVLELTWNHTWVGDVVLTLSYDVDCEGPAAEVSTRVVCRPRGTVATTAVPCGPNATSVGCGSNIGTSATNSANLPATYRFSDEAVAPIAEGTCPTLTPAGCYKPSTGSTFAIFRGLNKGGCWRLRAADYAAGDVGTITTWAVNVRNQTPVPVTAASWGQIKSTYR